MNTQILGGQAPRPHPSRQSRHPQASLPAHGTLSRFLCPEDVRFLPLSGLSIPAWLAIIMTVAAFPSPLQAQTVHSVPLHVTEPAGIRRFGFPVSARIPLPRGTLTDALHSRILLKGTQVPAQSYAESRWPDGSIQWLDVDFNVTLGPKETTTFALEYGENVATPAPARGLAVHEDPDGVQVGNVRFGKSGAPLIASVKYREEAIGMGPNGISVTDSSGAIHDLSSVDGLKAEVVKPGPLRVVVKYQGSFSLGGNYQAPFTVTMEMPNSKSWVRIDAVVQDPAKRLRDLSLATPLAFGPNPLVWDFGTERWTYGSLAKDTDSVSLDEVVERNGVTKWSVSTGPRGREALYDTATQSRPISWLHLQDAKDAVAFAIEDAMGSPGAYRVAIDGKGQTSFRFTPAQASAQLHLTVYEHFVPTPVQIGAATSPVSILNPVLAFCDRDQYIQSGLPPPSEDPERAH